MPGGTFRRCDGQCTDLVVRVQAVQGRPIDYGEEERRLLETSLGAPVRFVFADAGFAGWLLDRRTSCAPPCTSCAKPADQRGFAALPLPVGGRADFAWPTAAGGRG